MVVHLLQLLRTALLIDEDISGALAGLAHERHLTQLLLHHPFELAAEEAVDQEDVEDALMVGNDDIALVGVKVFATFDLHGQQENTYYGTRPPAAWIVAPPRSVEEGAAYDGKQ